MNEPVNHDLTNAATLIALLQERNDDYVAGIEHQGDISADARAHGAEQGQSPFAVVITCSDSRVVPEHLFNAGLGELFVIRTAGNVIGPFELGSIEYAADHLGTPLVLVLGHTHCGAVDAALSGGGHGAVAAITDDITAALSDESDPRKAEILNVQHSLDRIRTSELVQTLETEGRLTLLGAIYDIESGRVTFIEADGD